MLYNNITLVLFTIEDDFSIKDQKMKYRKYFKL